MKCNGCKHCRLLHYPDDYSPKHMHYCDIFLDVDKIGDAFKLCRARYFEIKDRGK